MKRKYLLSNGILGIILMFSCQLCFSINDSLVKLSVEEIDNNISTLNVIFIRGLFSTFFIFVYLKVIQKKKYLKS